MMNIRTLPKFLLAGLAFITLSCILTGCSSADSSKKESVIIYTSIEDYRIAYLNKRLEEEFPQYDVYVKFLSTGEHASSLLEDGTDTECDITHSLSYSYLQQLDDKGYLADLSSYDTSVYDDSLIVSRDFLPQERGSGAIIINPDTLKEYGLSEPESYEDLLKPEYRGLISMPDPRKSSTGYMFYKSLVNAWGEDKAISYFSSLTDNILQYTESGSGPLKAVAEGKAAIGLGTTATAVASINEGSDLEIRFFREGAPYTAYGQAIIKGKEQRRAVKEVFDYLVNTFNYENCQLYMPESLYRNRSFTLDNYPQSITYADMSNDTIDEKERLLEKWNF